jgi:hypothetical protein
MLPKYGRTALVIFPVLGYSLAEHWGTGMPRLLSIGLAGLLATLLFLAAPAVKAEPAQVALPEINLSIGDGAGGKHKLRILGMLQPKRVSHVAKVRAKADAIAAAFKARIRFVESKQLIPPTGDTGWLEKDLWALAEHMLKPIELDGAYFKELSIE